MCILTMYTCVPRGRSYFLHCTDTCGHMVFQSKTTGFPDSWAHSSNAARLQVRRKLNGSTKFPSKSRISSFIGHHVL